MTTNRPTFTAAALALGIAIASVPAAAAARDLGETSDKPRLVVITDIGTEPDDMESMVRLLTYANEFDIEALLASTSRHLRDRTYPQLIEERVRAYGEALPNLRVHAKGYPDAATLLARIGSHTPVYGMAGVGDGKDNDASRRIIAAVDAPDSRPVWVTIWGGAASLAQALWTVRATRTPAEVERFVSKLRVYSISDQDDAGPWARMTFPKLFWIASIHGTTQYELAAWTGISTLNLPGADDEPVSKAWLRANIRSKGPLGAVYPAPIFIMEGDTPSFLYLIPNGLGSAEYPNWGSWGGRYEQLAGLPGLWTDAQDSVMGVDGKVFRNNKATVWRWRQAFQNDFAARMQWSVTPRYKDANHPPELVLNGQRGERPVEIAACPGQPVKLSAAGTKDPDGQPPTYRWWRYGEASGALYTPTTTLSGESESERIFTAPAWEQPFKIELPRDGYKFHVILEVSDNGSPSLTRYRRAVVTVPTDGGSVAGVLCTAIKVGARPPDPNLVSDSAVARPLTSSGYSTAESEIGELVDDPAARAVIDKYLPGFTVKAASSPQGRGMTLSAVKHFDPRITDELLRKIDAELAKLPKK